MEETLGGNIPHVKNICNNKNMTKKLKHILKNHSTAFKDYM